jgi:hypothetical protein
MEVIDVLSRAPIVVADFDFALQVISRNHETADRARFTATGCPEDAVGFAPRKPASAHLLASFLAEHMMFVWHGEREYAASSSLTQ